MRRQNKERWWAGVVAAAVLLAGAGQAGALINPKFTPVQLVAESSVVVALEVGPVADKGQMPVKVGKRLKGKADSVVLDASKASPNRLTELREAVGDKPRPAMLFAGQYKGLGETEGKDKGLLHVGHTWFPLVRDEKGHWQVAEGETQLQAVWAGGSDMLQKAVEYVLENPTASLPVEAGITWGTQTKVATVAGKVHGAMAVDLKGDGKLSLFVASAGGDRVFACAGEKFAETTETLKLASKSRAAAWGRFAQGPRATLASWDGKGLSLWASREDGTFAGTPVETGVKECLGLAVLDVGAKGRAGILVSTSGSPVVLTPGASGWTASQLPGAAGQEKLGAAGACVVADLDGDGIADILQPFEKGGVIRKGVKGGGFAAALVVPELSAGLGRPAAVVGDFAGSGLLDVVTLSEGGVGYCANLGGMKFRDTTAESGEFGYKVQRNAVGGTVCDLNTDGRQDLVLLYGDSFPQLFFNRGFRSFGQANSLGFENNETVPETDKGQQAAVMADFAGTGAQTLALVLANGDLWALFRSPKDTASTAGVRVVTGADGPVGPTSVIGWEGKRCLGAQVIAPGRPGFFGRPTKGLIKLEWKGAEGAVQTKSVMVVKPGVVELRGE